MVRNEFTFPPQGDPPGGGAPEPPGVLVLPGASAPDAPPPQGFAVAGHDHLGHGLSVAAGAPRLYFGPRGSWDWAVQDLYARQGAGRAAVPRPSGVPAGAFHGVLPGPDVSDPLPRHRGRSHPDGHGADAPRRWWRQAASLPPGRPERWGDRHSSPLVNKLAFEAYNQKFAPTARDTTGSPPARRTWTSILRIPSAEGTPPSDSFGRCCGGSPALRSKRT